MKRKSENKNICIWSLDEMNDVENCIVFALYKVAKRVERARHKVRGIF
jgi:hypothetical protein